MNLQDKIKVMQAYADGKSVEVRNRAGSKWSLETNPVWNWYECEYRIKKEDENVFNPIMPDTPHISPRKMFDDFATNLIEGTMKRADIAAWREIHYKIINALLTKKDMADDIDRISEKATKLMLSMMVFERNVTKSPHALDEAKL